MVDRLVKRLVKDYEFDELTSKELIASTIKNMPLYLNETKEILLNEEIRAFLIKIHQLKGLAGNLKMYEIVDMTINIEKFCHNSDNKLSEENTTSINGLLKKISELLKSIQVQLN